MKINSLRPTAAMFAGLAVFAFASPALAQSDTRVAEEVMALARAQWAADIAGKPVAEQMAATADDYTEFNPAFPVRLDGKALATRMAMPDPTARSALSEMQNAKVQTYGDTAILTYNYVGMTKDANGKLTPNLAKSTRVYARTGGRWMLVHAHFSPITAD